MRSLSPDADACADTLPSLALTAMGKGSAPFWSDTHSLIAKTIARSAAARAAHSANYVDFFTNQLGETQDAAKSAEYSIPREEGNPL